MDECLNEFIDTVENSIKLLKELADEIEAHHKRCNTAKTAGTTASVAGSALTIGCIIAAPFTGGASIVALTGFGVATAVAGAVTNIGTDVADMFWTKKYLKDLEEIAKRRESVATRFNEYLVLIQNEASRIYRENGNEEEAFREAMENLIMNGEIGWSGNQVSDMAKNMGRTTGAMFLRNGRNFNVTLLRSGGKLWRGMRINSQLLNSALKKLGLEVSKRTAFNVVKGVTVAINAIFIIWDITSLVNSLKSNHPVVEPVNQQVNSLTELLSILRDFRDSFDG